MVELAALEKRCAARYQGFESLSLRHKKRPIEMGYFLWYTTDKKVYTQLKQEGRRWREILDPMYREYKLQIQRHS